MADRIVILAANPGRVRTIVENKLPRPRDYRSPQLLTSSIGCTRSSHTAKCRTWRRRPARSRRRRSTSRCPRRCRARWSASWSTSTPAAARKTSTGSAATRNREYGQVINIVKAAEMMDLVDTPKRLVVLEPDGKAFVTASPPDRQALWRQHLLRLRLFRDVYEALKKQPRDEIDDEFVRQLVALYMPQESNDRVFQTFLHWARSATCSSTTRRRRSCRWRRNSRRRPMDELTRSARYLVQFAFGIHIIQAGKRQIVPLPILIIPPRGQRGVNFLPRKRCGRGCLSGIIP